MLGNSLLQFLFLCSNHLVHNLPLFQEHESWHGLHCPVSGNTLQNKKINQKKKKKKFNWKVIYPKKLYTIVSYLQFIHINLQKQDIRQFLGQLCQERSNETAWSAPRSSEINNNLYQWRSSGNAKQLLTAKPSIIIKWVVLHIPNFLSQKVIPNDVAFINWLVR